MQVMEAFKQLVDSCPWRSTIIPAPHFAMEGEKHIREIDTTHILTIKQSQHNPLIHHETISSNVKDICQQKL